VELRYDVAGIGSRFLAALIDVTIQAVLLFVFLLVAALLAGVAGQIPGFDEFFENVGVILVIFAWFLIFWFYFPFFETVWNGQTPGKRMVRLRVIKENGYPIGPVEALVRNLVRIVDFLPAGYLIGVIAMLCSRNARRLGDLAAGTVVVRERPAVRLEELTPFLPPAPARGEPVLGVQLSAEERAVLREFLLRRAMLPTAARQELAAQIARSLRARHGIVSPLADEELLLTLGAEAGARPPSSAAGG